MTDEDGRIERGRDVGNIIKTLVQIHLSFK